MGRYADADALGRRGRFLQLDITLLVTTHARAQAGGGPVTWVSPS
jgi:hypothetical protein